jgi:hypothetical protein
MVVSIRLSRVGTSCASGSISCTGPCLQGHVWKESSLDQEKKKKKKKKNKKTTRYEQFDRVNRGTQRYLPQECLAVPYHHSEL